MKKKSRFNLGVIYPIILVLSIALSVVVISRGQHIVDATQQKVRDLEVEKKEKEQANSELQEKIDKMTTREYIERVARDKLMMAKPEETIYVFDEGEEASD